MLDDKIENIDIFDVLGSSDCLTIEKAQRVIETSPTSFFSGDGIDKKWFEDNIKSQNELLNLKCRIGYLKNTFELQCSEIRGNSLDDYEFKSKDMRENAMIATDSEFKDKLETIDKLTWVFNYCDGLFWVLKDLMKLFKVS